MGSIFIKESQVIINAEKVLASGEFKEKNAIEKYSELLEEYRALFKQITKMDKMSGMMQLELKNLSENLELASRIDALTGIYNPSFFDEMYEKEWKNSFRTKLPISAIMIDIDYFKKYNDTYGHIKGDECLKLVAYEIQKLANRPRDIVSRFGGEEFIILLPETEIDGAISVANLILESIHNLKIDHSGSPYNEMLTVSLGVASVIPSNKITKDEFLTMIHSALYKAKDAGRNCFRLFKE